MASAPDQTTVDPIPNNAASVTPIPPPLEAVPGMADVLRAGLTTGITASLVCWLLYGIASLFGTDFDVRTGTGDGLMHVSWYQILIVPTVAAYLFAAITATLRERRSCRKKALLVGYTLGAISLLAVVLQPADVTWPTKIWLALFHVITIVLVVPQLARVVGDSDPAVTAGHRRQGLDAA